MIYCYYSRNILKDIERRAHSALQPSPHSHPLIPTESAAKWSSTLRTLPATLPTLPTLHPLAAGSMTCLPSPCLQWFSRRPQGQRTEGHLLPRLDQAAWNGRSVPGDARAEQRPSEPSTWGVTRSLGSKHGCSEVGSDDPPSVHKEFTSSIAHAIVHGHSV